MKLRRSRTGKFPDNTTIRWVIDEYDEMIGMIGTAGDLTAAKLVTPVTEEQHPEHWLAIPVSTDEKIQESSTREEALAFFKDRQKRKGW